VRGCCGVTVTTLRGDGHSFFVDTDARGKVAAEESLSLCRPKLSRSAVDATLYGLAEQISKGLLQISFWA
jgi:hypothetical protein